MQILSNFLVMASAAFYYYAPVSLDEPHPILDIVGLIVLIVLIVRQLIKQLAAGPDWTVSGLVDRQLNLPGSADRRNGYGIDTSSVHR